MKNLLSIEWLKMKKYKTFWILVGFFIVLLPIWHYSITTGMLKISGNAGSQLLNSSNTFNHIWQNLGFWTSYFVIFISILTIILTTNEYSFRTNRQNVIDGYTRLQFLNSKWLMVLAFALASTIYVFIIGTILAATNDNFANFPGKIENLFYVFLLSLNYYSFSLLLSFFFKRSGISIGIFFLYNMIIETLLKNLLNWKFESNPGNYLPLQASDEMLPFPLSNIAKTVLQMDKGHDVIWYILASVSWIIIYYLIGRARLLKSDW
jgi:ABC-2 type transport system permease protein